MNFTTWYDENRGNPNWYRNLQKLDESTFNVLKNWVGDSPSEKEFLFLNDLKVRPLCQCGNYLKWYKQFGYTKGCSSKCSSIATAEARSKILKSKSSEEKKAIWEKMHKTKVEKYGKDYARLAMVNQTAEDRAKSEQARKKSMIEKYGVSNPSSLADVQAKRRTAYSKRTEEQRINTKIKRTSTRVANGTSVPDDHPSIMGTKKQYTRRVRYLTDLTIRENKLFDSRSMECHVDHKYSILEGFRNQVPPKLIAHPANLCLLHRSENSKKNSKCSILLSELMLLTRDDLV